MEHRIKPVEIRVKDRAVPHRAPPQRVSVPTQDALKAKLDDMEDQDTITKLDNVLHPSG